ncbi:F-box/WD repeat-containing protein 7-like [Salvelinus fontinalis]|uniref:F-box/WD repeat-containing protein 7-like n=1 Tax=Salvelinus fontinalis TaxID=8038 RepID=UPI002486A3CA|nr:F-box/WD repeat-containing protein 7-like [Salvelinus fontinalis]
MKQDPLTRGVNTGTPLPGRRDSIGVSLLGSTPSSSSISSISSSISSSSSGEERRKGGGEEFIGREEEEGEVVSISIVTIAEESCPSEPFGTVVGHVEVTANESAARERDGQSKTSHSTQTEEEGVRNGEEGEEGRKEDDEKEQGDEGEEAEEMGEDESDRSALLEEDEEGRKQVFVSDENLELTSDRLNPETPSSLFDIKMKRKLDHGPDIRPFPSGKKHCKGSNYLSYCGKQKAWSGPERLLALDELIDSCESNQVKHMMQVIEPQFQRDFISLLPKELALYVLTFLGPRDLMHAAQTCSYWRILAEDNLLWREKCREEGIEEPLVVKRRKTGFLHSPWKSGYVQQHHIESNWRTGDITSPKVLKGHDDHVITCLQFCGDLIVSGSDDNTLKVWSALTGKCLRTLVGHTGGVWSSQMSGNIVISGSTDRTLKVWDAESGECVHTLYGHTSTVRCIHLHDKQVVSGSRDATLRLWDIDSGECLHVLTGHVAAVRCVQYDGRRVVSGGYDFMVKVWDPETETCLHTLQGHTNRVYSLQFDGAYVVSGSLDTSIRVWDVVTGACVHTLTGHQSLTSGMELKNNILVSGNADSTVRVWDILTGQCLHTLQGPHKHQSAVTCLQFSRSLVVSSSDDGTVKLWSLATGEWIRDLVALQSGGSGGVVWRIRASNTRLVAAVGSRNGTEETKLMVLDFDLTDNHK